MVWSGTSSQFQSFVVVVVVVVVLVVVVVVSFVWFQLMLTLMWSDKQTRIFS